MQRVNNFALSRMRRTLIIHPGSRCVAAKRVEVEIALPRPGNLVLEYIVTGQLSELRIPPVTSPTRADELWQHTCFEAFVRAATDPSYYEFNFAPSTQWAAYRFAGYRNGMSLADEIPTPQFKVQSDGASFRLQTAIELGSLSGLPRDAAWRVGVSAVIEEADGRKSYWALAHPPGKPDFHHSDGFAHQFAAADRP